VGVPAQTGLLAFHVPLEEGLCGTRCRYCHRHRGPALAFLVFRAAPTTRRAPARAPGAGRPRSASWVV
jgi:hypothetical protein